MLKKNYAKESIFKGNTTNTTIPISVKNDRRTFLELHGKTFEDSFPLLERWIDRAVMNGFPQIIINHGKGTGVLKEKIHDYLRKNKKVKKFECPINNIGVTVVKIKI